MAALHAGSAAPAFTLTDTKGNVLTLESLKGKKVYLILFRVAPWPLPPLPPDCITAQEDGPGVVQGKHGDRLRL